MGPRRGSRPCQHHGVFVHLSVWPLFEEPIERALRHVFVPSRRAVRATLDDCACASQCVQGVGDTAVQVRQVVSHIVFPSWDEPFL
jgi:hypothetical protein